MGVEIELKSYLKEVEAKIDSTIKERMNDAVNEVRNQTLETLSGARSGRQYKIPGTQRIYTASAPGEPPATATSRLKQSVATDVSGDGLEGIVGTDIDYGKKLEYGDSKIEARPWLKVSFEKSANAIKEIFTKKWF